MIYIFWSCADKTEAKKIIHQLLELRLIACASIFPEVESIYRWEGKVEEGREAKVILKRLSLKKFSSILGIILRRFLIHFRGGYINFVYYPPENESKIGVKEPQNRLKLFSTTVSKTVSKHFDEIQNVIKSECSYEVPEIVQVDVSRADSRYLLWVDESLFKE